MEEHPSSSLFLNKGEMVDKRDEVTADFAIFEDKQSLIQSTTLDSASKWEFCTDSGKLIRMIMTELVINAMAVLGDNSEETVASKWEFYADFEKPLHGMESRVVIIQRVTVLNWSAYCNTE